MTHSALPLGAFARPSSRFSFVRGGGLLLALLALLLTGCVDAPDRFRVMRVAKARFRADHLLLRFDCSVHNPNGSTLRVRDLTAALRVEGVEVGQLEPVDRLVLRRRKTTEFSADIAVPYAALLKLAPMLLTRSDFRVQVEGQCRAGTWWTFRHRVHSSEFLTVDIREALYKQLLEALKRKKSGDTSDED